MNCRRAFTLVELLVVAGIFAMLFGLIVVGRRGLKNQVINAAKTVAAELRKAQTRSPDSDLGAGLIFDPDTPDTATVLADAAPRAAIRGAGLLTVASATATSAVLQPGMPYNADPADLADGYRIQLWQGAPVCRPSVWLSLTGTYTVALRSDAAQTVSNTIWPDTSGNPYEFIALRYPDRAGNQVALPSAAAVDLRFSGGGSDPFAAFGSLRNAGSIAICFNRMGQVDSLARDVFKTNDVRGETEPNVDLYILVAARDAIANGRSLASAESQWIVVKPSSGRVTMAANVPQVIDEGFLNSTKPAEQGQLRTAVWNARAKARAGANMR